MRRMASPGPLGAVTWGSMLHEASGEEATASWWRAFVRLRDWIFFSPMGSREEPSDGVRGGGWRDRCQSQGGHTEGF